MTVPSSVNLHIATLPIKLGPRLLEYTLQVPELTSPEEVLDRLHTITAETLSLNVLGALRFPQKITDWKSVCLGKTVFLHKDAPSGWWEEWVRLAPYKTPVSILLARSCLAPHTWTESLQLLQPVGVDRWGYELALKNGMRDGFSCPVGGRWLIAFWSGKVLSNVLTQPARICVFAAASFAAMRIEQLTPLEVPGKATQAQLTARELAVLRLLSVGMPFKEIAARLELGEETVRTHIKKAQAKLGVRNRTQAVAEALREHLIP